jgi:hypothetical protein
MVGSVVLMCSFIAERPGIFLPTRLHHRKRPFANRIGYMPFACTGQSAESREQRADLRQACQRSLPSQSSITAARWAWLIIRGYRYAGTNSIFTLRPSDLAARLSVASVTDVFSGSSNRWIAARDVRIRAAIALLFIRCRLIKSCTFSATARLRAAACTSSCRPWFFRKLSKLLPLCLFFFFLVFTLKSARREPHKLPVRKRRASTLFVLYPHSSPNRCDR